MPAPKKAAALVSEVEHELADTSARIEQERQKREAALLADDGHALDQIELTMSRLSRAAGRQQERLRLLQQQVQQEEQAAVNKRREQLRERFAKKLAESDQAATELQQTLAHLVTLYRKIIDLRESARAAWSIGDAHQNASAGAVEGAALSGAAVKALLSFELYRYTDPFLGGRAGELRQVSLPGAVCPRLDWQLQPDKITPFADALKRASAFAVETMAGLDPLRAAQNVGEAIAPAEPDARTAAEVRLAQLLRQQADAAADTSEAGERRYMEIVAELAKLSNETQPGATK